MGSRGPGNVGNVPVGGTFAPNLLECLSACQFEVTNFIRSEYIDRLRTFRKWITDMTFKSHSRLSGI